MGGIPNTVRRGGVYHFRRAVPVGLTEVAHIDPKTGEQTLRYPVGHPRRAGLEAEMDRINHGISQLTGREGEKRLKAAMDKSIAASLRAYRRGIAWLCRRSNSA